jgi:hypothetical protein
MLSVHVWNMTFISFHLQQADSQSYNAISATRGPVIQVHQIVLILTTSDRPGSKVTGEGLDGWSSVAGMVAWIFGCIHS